MTREQKTEYLRIGLALQGVGVSKQFCERVVVTYDAILEKGGQFSIDDAVRIEYELDQKQAEKNIEARKNEG